ncbi:Protein of unknown function DUF58 [Desulfotomaculum arcticum]|uniref:DUF58 domain-containing protein n=1 Tax=Desulfotruncus arcticus DSM 17038 TaxID=1121424 RepID=A0A1I2SWI8_9FIRM|nr:DUF58 domain-containing protein [Desulfotruncus arcticus]SFG57094.1 Protein of unknown function DUF58 [Desulfotomaculum arcticum] [Desulfotruncus arcticus DSM 17038]
MDNLSDNLALGHFLKEIEQLIVFTRKRLVKGDAGSRRGKGRGISLDFHGHRGYLPGDDIRRVDWKAYSRTGNLYVREYTEERQLQVNIFLDSSASMDFGSPNKWVLARQVALGLSYITLKQGDKLSFYVLNDPIRVIRKQAGGKESFYHLLRQVRELKPAGPTAFSGITGSKLPGSGMTFVISDLFGEGLPEALDHLCSGGQEVAVLHLLSPQETDPGYEGEWKFIDLETGEARPVRLDQRTRAIYRVKVNEYLQNCAAICRRRGVRYVFGSTGQAPVALVAAATGIRR